MQRKEQSGITLIALVITIIVLLILAGISIAMLTGENGILAQASKAKVETRGASVQEVRDLWFTEKKLTTAKSLDEVLNDLKKQNLLTDEEVAEVKETGQVTIGSRTIVFGEDKNVELVAKVIGGMREYTIGIGFEEYQVETDQNKYQVPKYLMKLTTEEKESLFVEAISSQEKVNFDNIEEVYKYLYNTKKTSQLCQTLEELTAEWEYNSVDTMLEEECEEVLYDRVPWKKDYIGKIIDPDGNENIISTEDIIVSTIFGDGLFDSYCYKYDISQNGSYEFKYIGDNGETAEITVVIDENTPCIVADGRFDSTRYRLMAGVGNYLDFDTAKVNNIIYKRIYKLEKDNIDISEYINGREIEVYDAKTKFRDQLFDAEIILSYNGKEYRNKASISLKDE